MYIFLIVLAVLAILIALIMFINAVMIFNYDKSNIFYVYIKFLFIKIKLYQSVQEKKDKEQKETKTGENSSTKTADTDKKAESTIDIHEKVSAQIHEPLDFIKRFFKVLKSFRHKIIITNMKIIINFGTGDAAETAVICGSIYALVYGLIGAAQNTFYITKPQVHINPDYSGKTANGEFYAEIKSRIFNIIRLIIRLLKDINKK